ncbi:MAG: J domain-containing protein [Planctomycetes bacterium]|nr:J domain-containing protein [Planctomycetota bacterium]
MADELSEDPRNWPQDPFELLGVEMSASETDIKRAYTRLIRRFKPEHFPEQFRLIREAYESALQGLKWRNFFPPSTLTPTRDTPDPESTDSPKPPESETLHVPRNAVDEAWSLVVAGKFAEAYVRLVELSHTQPENANLALRLYWLLAVHPAVDSERTRHDWLSAAIKRSRLTAEATTLYRRELEVNPDAALTGPYLRLLDSASTPESLLSVARSRLAAAGLHRMWEVVDIDLQALAERVGEFDESGWLSYLVSAMGHLGFEYPAPAYNRCRQLLAGLKHLQLRESWAFDQLEEHEQMTRLWGAGMKVPKAVLDVVRDAWIGASGGWRQAMSRASAWVLEYPSPALQQFDQAASDHEARPLMSVFNQLVTNLMQSNNSTHYPSGVIRGHVRVFLAEKKYSGYAAIRSDLLRLLLREAINPEEVVQACIVDPEYASRLLVESLRNDPVLHLVWQTGSLGSQ